MWPKAYSYRHLRRRLWVAIVLMFALFVTSPATAEVPPLTGADGRRLDIDISEEFSDWQGQQIHEWIESIADSLSSVYGHWPRKHWKIKVVNASGASGDPIPWAQVTRGDVDEIEFFVVEHIDAASLTREWTGYHELAHLLIPYRGWGDAWFSEGLASYYQNLLQARSGIITEQQMWQKLHDGFMRGAADSQFNGKTLDTVSTGLREHGGFMRVYWSGAWYFLAVDLALRSQPSGLLSLDSALQKLNDCCAEHSMSVPAMVETLDGLNRVDVFSDFYRQVKQSTAQPPFESLFAALGIRVVDGVVSLEQGSEAAKLRRGISTANPL